MHMTSRERVLAAIRHQEPDRVPLDLGGCDSSGIHVVACKALREFLGLGAGRLRVFDPAEQLAAVEPDLIKKLSVDAAAIQQWPKTWEAGPVMGGFTAEWPAGWKRETLSDGTEIVRDRQGNIAGRRPTSSCYFEFRTYPLAGVQAISELKAHRKVFENFDLPFYADETLKDLAVRARTLYRDTDLFLVGNFSVHVFAAGQWLRGDDQFLVDLLLAPALAEAIMEQLVDVYIERFNRWWAAVGPYIQTVQVNDDLGMQQGPTISPELYRRMIKPHHQRLFSHLKKKSGLPLFLHSCGSVIKLIPDLIEAGVDILNPVQLSAADMDPARLKREFGRDLVFWGGGCDTQRVLPFGRPEEVEAEVKRRIDTLAPGGGFVFTQVHNIQPDVPVRNIETLFKTALTYGS